MTSIRLRALPALVTLLVFFGQIGREASRISGAAYAEDRPSMYVYVHTEAKSAALESGLKEKLKGLDVTVFGRYPDFEEAMGARRPDSVLALQSLLASENVPVTLQGFHGDSDAEPYVLLSSGAALEGSLSGKMLGVVDMLGRKGTQDFISALLKTPDVKLKRVTKLEDLLPLLQFSAVDAVLVPGTAVKGVTERSRLPLKVRDLTDVKVKLPAVGVLNAKARDTVVKQIQGLDGEMNRILGIERWRAPR